MCFYEADRFSERIESMSSDADNDGVGYESVLEVCRHEGKR